MAKYDLFISYSRGDSAAVQGIVNMLSARIPSLSCCIETESDTLDEAVKDAINDSLCVLYVQSDEANHSPRVKDEVSYAKSLGKMVIPLLVAGAKMRGWYMFKYGSLGFIDSTKPEAMETLVSCLLSLTAKTACEAVEASHEYKAENLHSIETFEPMSAPSDSMADTPAPEENCREQQGAGSSPFVYELNTDRVAENAHFIDEIHPFGTTCEPAFESASETVDACDEPLDEEIERVTEECEDESVDDEYPYAYSQEVGERESAYDNNSDELSADAEDEPFEPRLGPFTIKVGPAEPQHSPCAADDEPLEPQDAPSQTEAEKKNNTRLVLIMMAILYVVFSLLGGSEYDTKRGCFCDRAAVERDGKWGFIDCDDDLVVSFKYDAVDDYKEGCAAVSVNGKWGFINLYGREITPLKYDKVSFFFNEYATVKLNEKWGIVDNKGREIVPPKYDYVSLFVGSLARVRAGKKWGFVNKSGEEVIPLKYDDIGAFYCDLARVKLNNKWGFVNEKGKVIVPLEYDEAKDYSLYRAAVCKDGKWGFVDNKNKIKIPLIYDTVRSFNDARAAVCKDGKWGFVDIENYVDIPPVYDRVEDFNEGKAKVYLNGKYFYINRAGKRVNG